MRRATSKRFSKPGPALPRREYRYKPSSGPASRPRRKISRQALGCALAQELRHGGDGIAHLHAALLLRRLAQLDAGVGETFELVLDGLDEDYCAMGR